MATLTSNNISIYKSTDGSLSFNVNVFEETVWLTQKQMGELFDRNQRTISDHINNIFKEGELEKNSVYRNFRYTTKHGAIEGKTQEAEVNLYNLDVIISVGYRVKSKRGTEFRKWATSILKQYLLNGYAINEKRVRQIEAQVDTLVAEQKLLREDVDGIKNLLLKPIERPIVIHNNISLTTPKLEQKIIELIDKLITETKAEEDNNKELIEELKRVEEEIKKPNKTKKQKKKYLPSLR